MHADHLGSPRAITRPSDDAILWRWDNDEPFGNNAANENPAGLGNFRYDLRFPGQQYDAETGTHYNYFRDYDPGIGRYLQSDPIGLGGGVATFSYSGEDPLRRVDPSGLISLKAELFSATATYGFGAGGGIYRAESECKCGRRVKLQGYFSSIGAGFGIGSNYGAEVASATMVDNAACPDAGVFNGVAMIGSLGFQLPGLGAGCGNVRARKYHLRWPSRVLRLGPSDWSWHRNGSLHRCVGRCLVICRIVRVLR